MSDHAILALEDGSIFFGQSIGVSGSTVGEVVFNTSMTGYQEILSDPSYAKQIITFTCPHIGNIGCNKQDQESTQVFASGLIVKELSPITSNWRSEMSLQSYLEKNKIIGIADIDTRRLTRLLRDKGALRGCIMAGTIDEAKALAEAKAFSGLNNLDLAKEVTTSEPYQWQQGSFSNDEPLTDEHHVVVYDFGVKHNILRLLRDRHCKLTVVPATTPAKDVLAMQPDGVFLSNGPGDPAACSYAIKAIHELLAAKMPLFGICLGHQLLALALGATTEKMKFGHHGANHPVKDLISERVFITSQNHGFTVSEKNFPKDLIITHRSLFDNTIQGIKHQHQFAMSFQGHPEASPGPHDMDGVFDEFIGLVNAAKGITSNLEQLGKSEAHAKTN